MMYVVLAAFVSQECNGPEMQPITHEKWSRVRVQIVDLWLS